MVKTIFTCMLIVCFSTVSFGSKKKTPPKQAEKTSIKKITGELKGKISKDKKDFKKYVFHTMDKKIWTISASSVDKIKKYYGRTIKLQATYYSKDGQNIIETIDSVSR